MTTTQTPDQRTNLAIRDMSQAGFGALLDALDAVDMGAVSGPLRGISKVEEIMRKSPAMVGMLLSLAWKYRETAALAPLFKGGGEKIVSDEVDPLAPCGRSFNDIRRAHLLGTARLYLAHTLKGQGDGTPSAAKPSALGRFWRIVTLQGLLNKKQPTPVPLHASLYAALKPYLLHHGQFELVEHYARLPLRHTTILGALLPALSSLQALEVARKQQPGDLKALVRATGVFATSVLAHAEHAEHYIALTAPMTGGATIALDDLVAGYALNALLAEYADAVPAILHDAEAAADIVKRLAPKVGVELWAVFREADCANNVRFCPEPIAAALGLNAGFVHDAVSSSLSAAQNLDAMGYVVAELVSDMGLEDFKAAASTPAHTRLWDNIVADLNRAPQLASGADLTLPKNISALHGVVTLGLRNLRPALAGSPTAKAA